MSPTTLGLSVLGLTTVSTGIGIAVFNLTNTNNENIEKKIEKLWEEITKNIGLLTSKIVEIMKDKDSDISKKYTKTLAKIVEIAETKDSTTQNSTTTYTLKESYKKTQESYQQLQTINQELQEIIKSLN